MLSISSTALCEMASPLEKQTSKVAKLILLRIKPFIKDETTLDESIFIDHLLGSRDARLLWNRDSDGLWPKDTVTPLLIQPGYH